MSSTAAGLLNERLNEARTAHAVPAKARVPSLDGWRGLGMLFVLASHSATSVGANGVLSRYVHTLGLTCVDMFFEISGFLITTLLVKELARTGTISIKKFFVRRAFRIWPAFYVYWLAILILTAAGLVKATGAELVSSAVYLWNYLPNQGNWYLGHTWTLSIEEQFYLCWPFILLLAGSRRGRGVAATIIVAEPFIRVAAYFALPGMRPRIGMMSLTRADTLMWGALAALLYDNERVQSFVRRTHVWPVHLAVGVFLLGINPICFELWPGRYPLTVGWSLEGFALALLMLWTVQDPSLLLSRFLNWKPILSLGLISYSLYLWQQLFLTGLNTSVTGRFPFSLAFCFVFALLSYRFVEQTFLNLRVRLALH